MVRQTEVLGTLLDHLAINFPQAIAGIDDLAGIGADLVSADEVLWSGQVSHRSVSRRGRAAAKVSPAARIVHTL